MAALNGISPESRERFRDYVAAHFGLQWPESRRKELDAGLADAATRSGFAEAEDYLAWLLSNPPSPGQTGLLAGFLTVGETYFFRDPSTFQSLEERILPELLRQRRERGRRLAIWSAGCCTGEEPFSVAILLAKMLPDWKDWNISILATDLNPAFLKKAREGIYGRWSFRETPNWVRDGYFTPLPGNRRQVLPDIRKRVVFAQYNLGQPHLPPPMPPGVESFDLVFCRNVLMYFTPERMQEAIGGLHRAMGDAGLLIVSPSEASQSFRPLFTPSVYPGAVVYEKASAEAAHPRPQPLPLTLTEPEPPASLRWADPGNRLERSEAPPEPEPPGTGDVRSSMPGEDPPGESAIAAPGAAAMAVLARSHANLGNLDEALAWCARSLERDAMHAGLHYLRATIQQERGEFAAAEKSLQRALYIDPGFILGHFALASLARRQGEAGKADHCFRHTLALLRACRPEEVLPESDGLTAGQLTDIVEARLADRRRG